MVLSRIRKKRRTDARRQDAARPSARSATDEVTVAQSVFATAVLFDGTDCFGERTRAMAPSVLVKSGSTL